MELEEAEEFEGGEQEEFVRQIFERFALYIRDRRDDAIKAREESGIENIWLEDEEYYEGIDDANRPFYVVKSKTTDGGLRRKPAENTPRSRVFCNMTRPYVDTASARVCDILIPTDDRNFALKPTPIPDLVEQLKDQRQVADVNGQPMTAPIVDENGQQAQVAGPDGQPVPAQKPLTVADFAQKEIDAARVACDRAQEEVDDYLVECQYHAEVRRVIEDCTKLGVGILKGPFPVKVKRKAVQKTSQGFKLVITEETRPASKRVDPWNFFPARDCIEDVQKCSGVFERDDITARGLMDLIGVEGYLEDQITEALEEGPIDIKTKLRKLKDGQRVSEKELFEIWYYHGMVSKKDMLSAGCECGNEEDEDFEKQYPAIVTMVNDRLIKVALSPLDSGDYPYDVMNWQRRVGHWAGIGVARQIRTDQDGLNAAVRCLMDNAGRSSRPYVVLRPDRVTPGPDPWTYVAGPEVDDVDDFMKFFVMPSIQAELMNIKEMWKRSAEESSGLPMLLQGQLGQAPDTVGGMQMLTNSANSVLRRIARTFDDRITVPHIGRYYEWILLHGPEEAKGDFSIEARGSSALVERDMQAQALMQMVGMSLNPAFELDPALVMEEMLKSQRFDPKRLKLSDEKKQAMAQQQPPPDPRIQVAQMNLQAKGQEKQADMQLEQMKLQIEQQESAADRQLEQWSKQLDAQIEAIKLSGQKAMSLDDIKAMLAKETMKIQSTKQLAAMNARANQMPKPPIEPAGRAPAGQSFTR